MTDLASLALKIDSTEVDPAATKLDKLTAAGQRAERQTESLSRTSRTASQAAGDLARSTQEMANRATGAQGASRMLSMQLSQVAQQAAAGGNALQALAIPLPDIAMGMGAAGASAGRFASFMGGPWGIAIASATSVLLPLIAKLFDTADAADAATSALRRQRQERLREMEEARTLTDGLGRVNDLRRQERDLLLEIKRVNPNNLMQANGTPMFATAQWQKLQAVRKELAETSEDMSRKVRELAPLNQLLETTTNGAATATARHAGASRSAGAALRAHSAAVKEQKDALDQLNPTLELANHWLDQMGQNASEWAKALTSKDAIQDIGDLFDELRKKQTGYIDKLVEAAEIAANRAQALMGAIGGVFGKIGGALTSTDPKAALLGMGGLGTIAGIVLAPNSINKLADDISAGVRNAFGQDTPFAGTMGKLISGAGVGSVIGGTLFGGSKSGQIGSMLGGAAGQAIGSSIAALGSFGGPIGSIVGAIAGGLLGGLLKKAKTGKATFGDDLSVTTSGNSNSRMAQASQLAGGVTDALRNIADALGADLGTFTGTVGIRNKSLRYDPTGMGNTKTSKGAIDFGQDQEALIKAVIKDAISDGVFEGLSEGVERILKAPGDIEQNLQKALTYKGIGDSLLAMKDPEGAAIAALDKQKKAWLEAVEAAGNAAEDIANVEELYGLKRVEIAKQAVEATRPAREQEIRILELLGKDQEALAASRRLELDTMDEALRAKQEYIYRLEDEAVAAAKAAEAQANLQNLNLRYFAALGNDSKVQELTRANELAAATDDNVRAMLRAIYAAEDLTAAQEAQAKSAQDAAEAAKRIADERYGLETQLLQLQGNTAELRARELAALDPANRALQQMIYGLQDAADAAAKEKAIADERMGLMRQLWQLTGNTAALREDALNQLDPSNRALQEYIWSLEDAKAAADAAKEAEQERASKLNDLRSQLTEAYNRESGALQQTIDKFRGFARTIADFRDNLMGQANPAMGFAMAQSAFRRTSTMAQFGNEASLSSFTGDAQAYLDAAKGGTYAQYRRAIGDVLAGSSGAIFGASGVANEAQRQLDAMQKQYDLLVEIKDQQISFAEALQNYQEATRAEVPAMTAVITNSLDQLTATVEQGNATATEAKQTVEAALTAMVVTLNAIDRRFRTWDDGDAIKTRAAA